MSAEIQETEPLQDMARRVLPGGSFGNVGVDVMIRAGKGGRVWDMDGAEYVDYLLGSGPMLVGHAHPEVTAAVQAQIPLGTTYFANNEHGVRLAAEVVDAVACADKVRFVNSGSEATFYAMRVARTHTKRDKILKFEGGFHGMHDYALMSMAPARPGNFPQATPDTPGIPQRVRDEMLIAPFNDADAAVSLIRDHAHELAGVIVEPLQRLMPPAPGFLQALRDVTTECGIALIYDEVVTGFRFAYGGAQEYYGVVPDLCAMGKVVGGGFPLALVAGREDYMVHFDKDTVPNDEFMVQISTLSGNPVAAVAGLATLEILRRPGAYERIFETGRILMDGLRDMLAMAGVPGQVVGEPPMFDVFFTDGAVTDYRSALTADAARAARFNASLRGSGILKGPKKFYASLAHDDADIAQTLAAFKTAVSVL